MLITIITKYNSLQLNKHQHEHGNLKTKILPVLFIFIFHLNVESFAKNCFSSHFIILVLYYIITNIYNTLFQNAIRSLFVNQ